MDLSDLPTAVVNAMKDAGLGRDALWKHKQSGKHIIYHWACEKAAAHKGVRFDPPTIVCADPDKKLATIVVTGHLGDAVEWSFGEAAPYNTTQTYPFAMAEKRAKDRVILKLLGLHGEVYSEVESDEFRQQADPPAQPPHGTAPFDEIENKPGEIGYEDGGLDGYMLLGADGRDLGTYTDPLDWLDGLEKAVKAVRQKRSLDGLKAGNRKTRDRILADHPNNDDVLDRNEQIRQLIGERDAELAQKGAA